MTTPMFRVAHYSDGKFNGMINPAVLKIATKDEARTIAQRWIASHGGKHDYRAVEVDAGGRLVWEDGKAAD